MKIYLASGFSIRESLRELSKELEAKGHKVTSGWIWLDERPERGTSEWDEFATKIAAENIIDMIRADALLVIAGGITPTNNGGVHFETGFMFARNKPVFLLGQKGNTFHWLPGITKVDSLKELLEVWLA